MTILHSLYSLTLQSFTMRRYGEPRSKAAELCVYVPASVHACAFIETTCVAFASVARRDCPLRDNETRPGNANSGNANSGNVLGSGHL